MTKLVPRILKFYIENFKSIHKCTVDLEPFTVLVGRNGSGKSNFLDAISFVQESLQQSIEIAFKNRGGIAAVRRISIGHPTHIGLRMMVQLDSNTGAEYEFKIAAKPGQNFNVAYERCAVRHFLDPDTDVEFEIKDGTFIKGIPGIKPKVASDRLALYAASATEEFRPIYDFLTSMRFYSIVPAQLRDLQNPDPGVYLRREGDNAAAILKRLSKEDPTRYQRVCRILAKIVQGVESVDYGTIGNKETLRFKQDIGGTSPWSFDALNMSDGTLRILGILLAIYQPNQHTVVGIEEPEATVHPAVADMIVDVLLSASQERQIILSTHSPDILDQKQISDSQIRAVTMNRGKTIISSLSASTRKAIKDKLYTAGELLRMDEIAGSQKEDDSSVEQFKFEWN